MDHFCIGCPHVAIPGFAHAQTEIDVVKCDLELLVQPTNFLIDPNGRIIGRNLRGEELEKKLGALFSM